MPAAEILFVVSVALILYPYVVYPLLLAVVARLRPHPVRRSAATGPLPAVSFIVAAHNEQASIEGRLQELIGMLEVRGNPADEILIVTDGSTDDTAAVVRLYTKHTVRLLELPARGGKAAAISRGVALARNPILVFADMRQTWAPDALTRLLENFADPAVGAVSGDLVLSAGDGTMAGVGLYWRFEKWLRQQESAVSSQVGVTGAISACRRELFQPIPAGTLLDDVYWPIGVALQGKRVIHDRRAVAHDRLPEKTGDEFRRKVRTLAGNFQLVQRRPRLLIPWRNPIWIQFLSHKMARLLVPWALLGLLVSCILSEGQLYDLVLAAQGVGYALAVVGLLTGRGGKLLGAASSFLVLNAAAWVAFWVWITGHAAQSWAKASYRAPVRNPPARAAGSSEAARVNA
jgi:poly-beta-1,6-N-acetyl-D-glucosamine synthase